jgi:hypothetical protein
MSIIKNFKYFTGGILLGTFSALYVIANAESRYERYRKEIRRLKNQIENSDFAPAVHNKNENFVFSVLFNSYKEWFVNTVVTVVKFVNDENRGKKIDDYIENFFEKNNMNKL